MQITQQRLQAIILEEYLKEEGIVDEAMSQEKADEFIAWIKKKGPKPDWLEREYGPGSYKRGKQTPAYDPNVDRSAETMPFPSDDMPQYDDEYDEEGAYDVEAEAPDAPVEDQIAALVQGMPPEEISDLFQSVFSKIPGVEMGEPEDEEVGTLYSPGAEGRPKVGFREIKQLVREILEEGHYHDMGGDDEMYDALDPHGFDKMSDYELIDAMETDGMEDMIVRDGEGGLVNREEAIAALKNV
jgi:hypothetical protein